MTGTWRHTNRYRQGNDDVQCHIEERERERASGSCGSKVTAPQRNHAEMGDGRTGYNMLVRVLSMGI